MAKSKSSSHWYPRYTGDIQRKTSHLSLQQMGVYDRLLDWYYSNGRPLPISWVQMHRICSAVAPDEQADVQTIVEQFFVLQDDGWHNKKADEELEKRADISEKRRKSQAERERRRLEALKNEGAFDGASGGASGGANAPTTTTTTTIEDTNVSSSPPLSPPEISMLFERVWNAYPGRGKDGATGAAYKGQKEAARKSFVKVLKDHRKEDHETLIGNITNACQRYGAYLDHSGYPSKHAATWLNQGGWKDDYSFGEIAPERSGRQPSPSQSRPSDAIAIALQDQSRRYKPED